MDTRAHGDHAPFADPRVAGHRGVGQDDREVPDRDPCPQNVVGKQMNMPAEGDIGHNGERTDIAAFADLSMRRDNRRGVDYGRPSATPQGRPLADALGFGGRSHGQQGIDLGAFHVVDEPDVVPQEQS